MHSKLVLEAVDDKLPDLVRSIYLMGSAVGDNVNITELRKTELWRLYASNSSFSEWLTYKTYQVWI
mgnify:CR=1 FL=1